MNTHDIELPPLPELPSYESDAFLPPTEVVAVSIVKALMTSYARAAIEAYRQRRGEPVAWPTKADEGMLRAMVAWGESDGREGLSGETAMMDRIYHALYSHMRENGYAPQPAEPVKAPSDAGFWPCDRNMSRKQLIERIGQMNFRLSALRQENAGLIRKNRNLLARYGQP